MRTWTSDELTGIGDAEELEITTFRKDGTPRASVPIWVVRVGDDLYVRSWRGREGAWFRAALGRSEGRIRAGGLERDVTFAEADPGVHAAIDAAYHAKYDRYGPRIVGPAAAAVTIRLVPR